VGKETQGLQIEADRYKMVQYLLKNRSEKTEKRQIECWERRGLLILC